MASGRLSLCFASPAATIRKRALRPVNANRGRGAVPAGQGFESLVVSRLAVPLLFVLQFKEQEMQAGGIVRHHRAAGAEILLHLFQWRQFVAAIGIGQT